MPTWTIKELPPLGRVLRLRLSGELDAVAALGLAEALAATGDAHDHVVVDLSGVSRLSAAGLRAIARDEHERAVRGGSLTLQGASPEVQRELARAGMRELAVGPPPQQATG